MPANSYANHTDLTGQRYRTERGEEVRLGLRVGGGGEATVYKVERRPDLVAKIYHAGRKVDGPKLAHLLCHAPTDPTRAQGHVSIAWVTSLLHDAAGSLRGFTMPWIHGGMPLMMVYNPRERWQHAWGFTWRYLHVAAANLASAVDAVHKAGYVIGDLNDSNVLVQPTAMLTLVDFDSFQVRLEDGTVRRCPVGRPEYTAPEAQGRDFKNFDRDEVHDRFALGVLLYLMLMEGNHPYKGTGEPPEVEERIRLGLFPFQARPPKGVSPARLAPEFGILPGPVQELFRRCFGRERVARPTAHEWRRALEAATGELVLCGKSASHYVAAGCSSCPWCVRRELFRGIDPFPSARPASPQPRRIPPVAAPRPLSSPRITVTAPPRPAWRTMLAWFRHSPRRVLNLVRVLVVLAFVARFMIFVPDPTPVKTPAVSRGLAPGRTSIPAVSPVDTTTPGAALSRSAGRPMTFEAIPAGRFRMGSDIGVEDARPIHDVRITRAFEMQSTEVTQAQWQMVMGSNPSSFRECGPNCPVENVSWEDAQQFLTKLNARNDGYEYRLPTEAEWEYAARAGTTGDYGGTGILDEMGWYERNAAGKTHPVAQKKPNAWGLYDMHGNVWEWVEDWHAPYSAAAATDPRGPVAGVAGRVVRGGGWLNVAAFTDSAFRHGVMPEDRGRTLGFRLVRIQSAARSLPPPSGGPASPPARSALSGEVAMTFALIRAGRFQMGSDNGYPDEQPVHEVRITHSFEMQRTEVTQAQWQTLMHANPSHFRSCGPNCPIESVSWDDAQQFIVQLNAKKDGYRYRLPTEAEWEYAARAGAAGNGNVGAATGRYGAISGSSTHPVAEKPPNAWGLYDMDGNASEWVEDRFGPYPDGVASDPRGPAVGDYRVFRGAPEAGGRVRSTFRSMTLANHSGDTMGFRVVRSQ